MRTPAHSRFRPLPVAAAIAMALVPATSQAIIYTVSSGMDNGGINPAPNSGTGTLRQAIIDANANCAGDPNPEIHFAIGTSPTFIGIGSPSVTTTNPLPALQCASNAFNPIIDGSTQPGHVPNSDPTGYNGTHGITIFGSGLTAASVCGIAFTQSPGVGGALTLRGINFNGFSTGNTSALCGTNMNVFGNTFTANFEGVEVLAGGTALIGNTAAADRNYIYGNTPFGVISFSANGITLANNFIGTTPDGNSNGGNSSGVSLNTIGSVVVQDNVIASNGSEGMRITGSPGIVIGNKIGVGSLGTPLPNGTGLYTDLTSNLLDVTNNTILHNTTGVQIAGGTRVRLAGNSISANSSKNVSLNMYGGPLPNDFQDVDTGPNLRQNYPVISSANPAGPNTQVNFTFNTAPSQTFQLEFYENSGPGIPGGLTPVTTTSVTTNTNGDSPTTTFVLSGARDYISVIARDSAGNTSEFSPIVAVTGAPGVSVSPPNLAFGNVPINTSSPSMTSTLLSTGTLPYQISQLSTGSCYGGPICYGGAEFSCSTTCVPFTPYAPGNSCSITATFNPTSTGPQTLNLVVCDNATGSPRTIALTGNGVVSSLSLTPSFFDFGDTPVNGRSTTAFFRVQNPSASPVSYAATTNGPFTILGTNCANPIPANGACDFDVGFFPTAEGSASGNLVVQAAGTANTASLFGNGVVAPVLSLPSNVDILYTLGNAPGQTRVTLSNTGTAPLTFTSIAISGLPFTLVNDCPATLAPGSACDLVIGFSATDRGIVDGTLTIVSNASGGSRVINLRGIAIAREIPVLEVTPREIGYGQLALGNVTDGELVKVRNIGGAPAVFDSFVIPGDFVILSNACRDRVLEPLGTCDMLVAMRPLAYGLRIGSLRINSNAVNSPNDVSIFGTSCRGSSLVLPRLGIPRGC